MEYTLKYVIDRFEGMSRGAILAHLKGMKKELREMGIKRNSQGQYPALVRIKEILGEQ